MGQVLCSMYVTVTIQVTQFILYKIMLFSN